MYCSIQQYDSAVRETEVRLARDRATNWRLADGTRDYNGCSVACPSPPRAPLSCIYKYILYCARRRRAFPPRDAAVYICREDIGGRWRTAGGRVTCVLRFADPMRYLYIYMYTQYKFRFRGWMAFLWFQVQGCCCCCCCFFNFVESKLIAIGRLR